MKYTNHAVGIDIGGTHIKSGIVDESGKISFYMNHNTKDWIDTGDFFGKLLQLMNEYREKDIQWFGIALPGLLDAGRNTIFEVPSISSIKGLKFASSIKSEFPGCQICIENDANAAAFGEYFFTRRNTGKSFALITLGTGIGCGLILNGRIFRGPGGNALELGEVISRNGHKLEKLTGVDGIRNRYEEILSIIRGPGKEIPSEYTISSIICNSREGEPAAIETLIETGRILGEGLISLIVLFDTTQLVFGGGIAEGFGIIRQGILECFNQHLPNYYLRRILLEKSVHGNMAGLLGMAGLCYLKNRKP